MDALVETIHAPINTLHKLAKLIVQLKRSSLMIKVFRKRL